MLNTPIHVGSLELKNRLVMPPMAMEKAEKGIVTDTLVRYYDRMTEGGYLGLVVQEHSFVSPEGQASPYQISMADDSFVEGQATLVSAIHHNGVPVIAQLNHAGSAAKRSLTGLEVISASSVVNPRAAISASRTQDLPREMTREDIDRVIQDFVKAAERAGNAGFDGVEIHSAHGYLLNQFYSPLSNKRTDAYTGTTVEGRTKLQVQIAREIRKHLGDAFLISLRLGACDEIEGGSVLEELPEASRIFADAGIDLLSISGGMCGFDRRGNRKQGWFADLSRACRDTVSVPVLLTGGIRDRDEAEKILRDGDADLIGVGRAFLKDPDLPKHWMENRTA